MAVCMVQQAHIRQSDITLHCGDCTKLYSIMIPDPCLPVCDLQMIRGRTRGSRRAGGRPVVITFLQD